MTEVRTHPLSTVCPRWSRDSQLTGVAFMGTTQGGQVDVFVKDCQDSTVHRVTRLAKDIGYIYDIAWSPEQQRIAFAASDHHQKWALFVASVNGELQKVYTTDGDLGTFRHPSWSPDGTRLAFQEYVPGHHDRILTVKADGTDLRQVSDPSTGIDQEPSFSPDGQHIVYEHFPTAPEPTHHTRSSIWQAKLDGSDAHPILEGGRRNKFPRWSADARTLFCIRVDGDNGQSRSLVAVDGRSQPREILANLSDPDKGYHVSPNGRAVVIQDQDKVTVRSVDDPTRETCVFEKAAVYAESIEPASVAIDHPRSHLAPTIKTGAGGDLLIAGIRVPRRMA